VFTDSLCGDYLLAPPHSLVLFQCYHPFCCVIVFS
jgi:hypothetical protein